MTFFVYTDVKYNHNQEMKFSVIMNRNLEVVNFSWRNIFVYIPAMSPMYKLKLGRLVIYPCSPLVVFFYLSSYIHKNSLYCSSLVSHAYLIVIHQVENHKLCDISRQKNKTVNDPIMQNMCIYALRCNVPFTQNQKTIPSCQFSVYYNSS